MTLEGIKSSQHRLRFYSLRQSIVIASHLINLTPCLNNHILLGMPFGMKQIQILPI